MSAFNCNTCRATFESINSVKEHYRSDLHVFNSKRRSKNLPPASAEEFDKAAAAIATKQKHVAVLPSVSKQSTGGGKHKVLNLATQPSQFAPATPEPVISTEMSLNKSNQTFDALANGNDNGMDVAEYEGEDNLTDLKHSGPDQIELPLGACVSIFDNKSFPNVESCVKHMAETNGFFIPDSDYLTDLEGLLEYLGEKVKMGSTCLYCQRRFSSGRACQHHMQQKSHCKVAYESEAAQEELEDFYDYSASYEDVSDDAEDEPAATICAVTGELILPDGRALGHRDLRLYYKQYYRPSEGRPSVLAQAREELLRMGSRVSGGSEAVERLTDAEVQTALVGYQRSARRAQIAEQRGMLRRLAIDQQREYKSKIQAARSSETTTAKIRDYHRGIM